MRVFSLATLVVASLSCSSETADDVPARACGLDVWYQPQDRAAQVYLVGSWDGFARPGIALRDTGRSDGYRHAFVDVDAGTYRYFLIDDGARVLDVNVPTTTFEPEATRGLSLRQYGGGGGTSRPADDEVNVVDVGTCAEPLLVVDSTRARDESSVLVRARFLANGVTPAAVDAERVQITNIDNGAISRASFVDPARGEIEFVVGGLPAGKARFVLEAHDRKGAAAPMVHAAAWLEREPLSPEDWVIYQVVIDRFRRGAHAPAEPSEAGGRAGGDLRGVISAIEDGSFERIGARALWLSPLYENPAGFFPGEPGRRYSSYHGYWPKEPRAVESDFGSEADLDELMQKAHTRGLRVLFDLVPNHVHSEHPYFTGRSSDALFNGTDGTCVCGSDQCPWNTSIQTCWFAPYLPDNNGRRDDVAQREAADATWWLERFGADGLRIDAVPMMTRALTRRIVWGARKRLEHAGHPLFFLGETFVGQDGFADLRYQLGPQGLSSQFHFPLMWALRGAVASEQQPMSAIDDVLVESAEQFAGSGAVMGTMIGNHDVTRFASESDGSAGGDGWTPAPTPTDAEVYQKQAFALGLVFALPGAPVIYYGDEIALAGARDPDSRRVYPANLSEAQRSTRSHTERLGQLRKCSDVLRRGSYRVLERADERLVFVRELEGRRVLVVAERAPEANPLALPAGSYREALSGATVTVADDGLPPAQQPWSLRLLFDAADPCAGE